MRGFCFSLRPLRLFSAASVVKIFAFIPTRAGFVPVVESQKALTAEIAEQIP